MKIEVKNNKLSITDIDISATAIKKATVSKKGKSKMLASTHGFSAVEGTEGVKVSLNVIAPIE